MEKFWWDVIGVLLAMVSFLSILLCFLSMSVFSGFLAIFCGVADAIYAANRPVWLEV